MFGNLKVPVEKEEREKEEMELNLELSIGGAYQKSEKEENEKDPCEANDKGLNDIPRPEFSCVNEDSGSDLVDLQTKRETQALRRKEARKKREEKLKKPRGLNVGGCSHDRFYLEAQQFNSRVQDRGVREDENESFLAEPFRKNEESCANEAGKDLYLSLNNSCGVIKNEGASVTSQKMPVNCLLPPMQYVQSANGYTRYPFLGPSLGPNVVKGKVNDGNVFPLVACKDSEECRNANESGNSSMDYDSENSAGKDRNRKSKAVPKGALEINSSAISDYQNMSQKGGNSSDTGSHTSYESMRGKQSVLSAPRVLLNQLESNNSACETAPKQGIKEAASAVSQLAPSKLAEKSVKSHDTSTMCSTLEYASSSPQKDANQAIGKPPKPQNRSHENTSLLHVPCVSTTGNGPNGKTIRGFLYKYNQTEVSIMCVCHGSSFSPAQFVEHAGGVDISHPLKHITVVSPGFG